MSATRILMNIRPNQGYGPDQIDNPVTLAELRDQIESAIEEWGEDAEVVTRDLDNRYGASYGRLVGDYGLLEDPDADDDL